MGDDEDLARPSLLLAGHDNAQREHKHLLRHKHHHYHKRQAAPTTTAVTEVVHTVSVIKQIDVDGQGRTLSIETIVQSARNSSSILTPSSPSESTTATLVASSPSPIATPTTPEFAPSPKPPAQEAPSAPPNPLPTPSSTPSPSTPAEPTDTSSSVSVETPPPGASDTSSLTESASSVPSEIEPPLQSTLSSTTSPILPLIPVQDATTSPTYTPLPTAPAALPFSSFSVPANITSLISKSKGFSQSFSNSSHHSNTLAHLTLLDVTSSRTKSTSARYSPTSSFRSAIATGTKGPGYIPGGGPLPPGATAASDSGSISDKSSAPSTPVVVASVVGSVAGASIIFLILLLLVKWWKRNQNRIALGDGDAIDGPESGLGGASSRGMIQQRSFAHVVPAALAGFTGYKRSSQKPEPEPFEPPPAERGFYRVSGRKLQSVLQTGGDGFGDEDVGGGNNTFNGSSSGGFYGGVGSSSSPHVGISIQRDPENPIMRPSPARTPVTEPGPFASMALPPLNIPPRRPDALGRSRPSQDSSHPSRFTELV